MSVRLSPSAVSLHRFVKPPPQVRSAFSARQRSAFFLVPSRSQPFVPPSLPPVQADAFQAIDVRGPANLVMPRNALAKFNAHGAQLRKSGFLREPFQHAV